MNEKVTASNCSNSQLGKGCVCMYPGEVRGEIRHGLSPPCPKLLLFSSGKKKQR